MDGYLGLFEEAEEAELLRPEDQEGVASAIDASGCPAHSVDVFLWTRSEALKTRLCCRGGITHTQIKSRTEIKLCFKQTFSPIFQKTSKKSVFMKLQPEND